jgi:hypothetical protein
MARLSVTADRNIEITFHGVDSDCFSEVSKRFDLPNNGKCLQIYLTRDGFYRKPDNIPSGEKGVVEVTWFAE